MRKCQIAKLQSSVERELDERNIKISVKSTAICKIVTYKR